MLRDLRESEGLTLRDFAEVIGAANPQSVSQYETNRALPSPAVVRLIERRFSRSAELGEGPRAYRAALDRERDRRALSRVVESWVESDGGRLLGERRFPGGAILSYYAPHHIGDREERPLDVWVVEPACDLRAAVESHGLPELIAATGSVDAELLGVPLLVGPDAVLSARARHFVRPLWSSEARVYGVRGWSLGRWAGAAEAMLAPAQILSIEVEATDPEERRVLWIDGWSAPPRSASRPLEPRERRLLELDRALLLPSPEPGRARLTVGLRAFGRGWLLSSLVEGDELRPSASSLGELLLAAVRLLHADEVERARSLGAALGEVSAPRARGELQASLLGSVALRVRGRGPRERLERIAIERAPERVLEAALARARASAVWRLPSPRRVEAFGTALASPEAALEIAPRDGPIASLLLAKPAGEILARVGPDSLLAAVAEPEASVSPLGLQAFERAAGELGRTGALSPEALAGLGRSETGLSHAVWWGVGCGLRLVAEALARSEARGSALQTLLRSPSAARCWLDAVEVLAPRPGCFLGALDAPHLLGLLGLSDPLELRVERRPLGATVHVSPRSASDGPPFVVHARVETIAHPLDAWVLGVDAFARCDPGAAFPQRLASAGYFTGLDTGRQAFDVHLDAGLGLGGVAPAGVVDAAETARRSLVEAVPGDPAACRQWIEALLDGGDGEGEPLHLFGAARLRVLARTVRGRRHVILGLLRGQATLVGAGSPEPRAELDAFLDRALEAAAE